MLEQKTLFFDTETTGFPCKGAALDDDRQPHIVQLAGVLFQGEQELETLNVLVKPLNWSIPEQATRVHGITTEHAFNNGVLLNDALRSFDKLCERADLLVAHNANFDLQVLASERLRCTFPPVSKPTFCTMLESTEICRLPGKFGKYKWPKLIEAYQFLFGCSFENAHDALADVRACAKVFFELQKRQGPRAQRVPSPGLVGAR